MSIDTRIAAYERLSAVLTPDEVSRAAAPLAMVAGAALAAHMAMVWRVRGGGLRRSVQ